MEYHIKYRVNVQKQKKERERIWSFNKKRDFLSCCWNNMKSSVRLSDPDTIRTVSVDSGNNWALIQSISTFCCLNRYVNRLPTLRTHSIWRRPCTAGLPSSVKGSKGPTSSFNFLLGWNQQPRDAVVSFSKIGCAISLAKPHQFGVLFSFIAIPRFAMPYFRRPPIPSITHHSCPKRPKSCSRGETLGPLVGLQTFRFTLLPPISSKKRLRITTGNWSMGEDIVRAFMILPKLRR